MIASESESTKIKCSSHERFRSIYSHQESYVKEWLLFITNKKVKACYKERKS
jgi:hypothetical protein